jgi:hypothetical protein
VREQIKQHVGDGDAACDTANVQPVAAGQSAVPSKSDRIERFIAEAVLRFGILAFWIKARKVEVPCAPCRCLMLSNG